MLRQFGSKGVSSFGKAPSKRIEVLCQAPRDKTGYHQVLSKDRCILTSTNAKRKFCAKPNTNLIGSQRLSVGIIKKPWNGCHHLVQAPLSEIQQRGKMRSVNSSNRLMTSMSSPLRDNASTKKTTSTETKAEDVASQGEKSTVAHNMGQRFEAAMNIRMSDLMGVWGAGLLFVGIIVSPFVIEKMKNSNQNYEIDEISDDDMTALTRQVLEYVKEVQTSQSPVSISNTDKDKVTEGTTEDSNLLIDASSDIISRVLQTDIVQDALIKLSVKVVQSPEVLQSAQILVKNLLNDMINDPDTLNQIVELLNKVIQDERTRKAVVDLVVQITADEEVNRAVTKMVVALGEEEEVMTATQILLTESAHKTLNDPEILDHSMEFAADVVGDDVVQRTSGEALWNTISYSFRPGFSYVVSALGISLVCFSFYLLGPRSSKISAEEASLVSSLASIGRDVNGNAMSGLSSLWSLPTRLLSNAGNAVTYVVLFPFRMAGNIVNGITNNITYGVKYALNSASATARYIPNWIISSTQNQMRTAGSMISSSFFGVGAQRTVQSAYSMGHTVGNVIYKVNDKFLLVDEAILRVAQVVVQSARKFFVGCKGLPTSLSTSLSSLSISSLSWGDLLNTVNTTSTKTISRLNSGFVFVWSWCSMRLRGIIRR